MRPSAAARAGRTAPTMGAVPGPPVAIRAAGRSRVFDSGVGGLTVLHELLVAAPARGLRLPRRHRALPVRRAHRRRSSSASRSRSPRRCSRAAVKLLVVACNSATAAALPALRRRMMETTLGVDVLGVVRPGGGRRRSPRPATGASGCSPRRPPSRSGAYAEALAAVDPHVDARRGPVPGPRADHPGAASRSTRTSSRSCAATSRRCARPASTR